MPTDKQIRIALLGPEIGSLTLNSIMCDRSDWEVVSKTLYTPDTSVHNIISGLIDKRPSVFFIGRFTYFETAEEVARQIKQYYPDVPVLGDIACRTDQTPKYMDDYLLMPTTLNQVVDIISRYIG